MIEPVNPGWDRPLVMEALKFTDDATTVFETASWVDENDLVTMKWSNATLKIRGGTLRAWIELGIITA